MSSYWIFMALGASVLWGLCYVLDQKVLETLEVAQFMLISSIFSGIVMFAYCYFAGEFASFADNLKKTDPKWLFATLIVATSAAFLIIHSIAASNASLAAIIEISYPLFTVLFGYLLLKNYQLHWSFFLGGAFILIGSFIVAYFHKA